MRLLIITIALLWSHAALSQTSWGQITYPVYGSVFQGKNDNTNTMNVSIQVQSPDSNPIDWRITVLQWNFSQPNSLGFSYHPVYNNIPLSNINSYNIKNIAGNSNFKLISGKLVGLTKNQFEIYLHVGNFSLFNGNIADRVVAGIGDVYLIAGQSNASGYNVSSKSLWLEDINILNRRGLHDWSETDDPTVPFYANAPNAFDFFTRSLDFNGRFSYSASIYNRGKLQNESDERYLENIKRARNYNALSPEDGNFFGIPFGYKYTRLRNGTDKVNDPVHIFPNGEASWYWSLLGQKIVQQKNTPTLFFNTATPGSSLIKDWTDTDINTLKPHKEKFLNTLSLQGSIHGVKAVLWHQGEEDAYRASSLASKSSDQISISEYSTRLNNLINKSRNQIGDNLNNLAWYISKVSLFTSPMNNLSDVNGNSGLSAPSSNSPTGSSGLANYFYTNSTLTDQQGNVYNSSNKVFAGVKNADNITNNSRDDKLKIHFSGEKNYNNQNTLDYMADQWLNSLYGSNNSVYNSYDGVAPKDIVKLESVTQNGSSITLTYEQIPNALYYFVQNQNGVYKGTVPGVQSQVVSYLNENNTGNRSYNYNISNLNSNTFLLCYVKIGNTFSVGQPYRVIPVGQAPNNKILDVANSQMNVSSQEQQIKNTVYSENVTWNIFSKPSWVNSVALIGSGDDVVLDISFSANTSASRNGQIILQETGGSFSKIINITQSGLNPLTSSLTSLNPTNSSSEWQGYGTAHFNGTSIDGNTINIGGTQYTQGIGTHANSRIVYNLNNAYSTFSGKFGMDQESNCCDGATFTIKADGQTIYGPVTKVWGQVATVVSGLSVAGKTTLELITDQISNNYADHTDWADVYLQSGGGGCGTPPIAPTSVSASPSSINSGGSSTLSASCAYGTVTWSTGATGGSISVSPGVTTNYTVKCVSAGCPDSPVVGVTVTVSNSPCSVVTDNLNMGTWTVSNHPLVVRYFNNQYWLTQRIGTNPEKFLVRGSNMLTRSDVYLINNTYANLTSCFAWQNSNYGGLAVPNTTQFPTPSGFTLAYEPDNTPFYTANGSCGLTAPTNVAASPGSISSGQSSTLSATCANGTRLWSTGATSATIVVNPTSTTTYTVKCMQAGCPDSPTSSVTVQVGPCAALSHNLVMGTWNVTGNQLVAKNYHNQWWLVQRIGTSPEKFLVRGAEMLSRSDVALVNGTYSNLVGCFSWPYSSYGGLATPNSTTFPTPSGWQYGTEPDGTPFYTSTGGTRLSSDIITVEETIPRFTSVYPNPNQGAFVVKVYLESESSLDIDLINSSGKIYQSIKYDGVEGQNEIPFTTENISGGNYLIRVKTKDKVQSTTVVIK